MAKKFRELRNQLSEAAKKRVDKKVQKALDDIMNSEDGNELAVAWNDGDERKAEKIIARSVRDKKLIGSVLELMFESINEAKESGVDVLAKSLKKDDADYLKKKVANNDWVAFSDLLSKRGFNMEKMADAIRKAKVDREERVAFALKKLSTPAGIKKFQSFKGY